MTASKTTPKPSRKPYFIVGALFVYLCLMAYLNRETLTVEHQYLKYFGVLGGELVVLVILFFVLRRREKLKAERLEDLSRAEQQRKQQ